MKTTATKITLMSNQKTKFRETPLILSSGSFSFSKPYRTGKTDQVLSAYAMKPYWRAEAQLRSFLTPAPDTVANFRPWPPHPRKTNPVPPGQRMGMAESRSGHFCT